METFSAIILQLKTYMNSLDWAYMITYIIICYGINHYKVREGLRRATGTHTATRYRVILIGLLYGITIYFLRGYTKEHIENLFESFIFALVFHKFIVESFLYYLAKHFLPEEISKHLLDEEQIKKIYTHEKK